MDAANDDRRDLVDHLMHSLGGGTSPVSAAHRERTLAAERTIALGCRMELEEIEDFEVLAALCFVLGKHVRRVFESVEVKRVLAERAVTPSNRLRKVVSLVLGSLPLAA